MITHIISLYKLLEHVLHFDVKIMREV